MFRRLLIAAFIVCGVLALGQRAVAQFGPPVYVAQPAGVAYTGPGDIQTSGWFFWYGFGAFDAAKTGTKAVNVKCSTCAPTSEDFNSLSSGAPDTADIQTYCGGVSNPNSCTATGYDQSGAGHDMPTAVPIAFGANCGGSPNPGICWTPGTSIAPAGAPAAQPWTWWVVTSPFGGSNSSAVSLQPFVGYGGQAQGAAALRLNQPYQSSNDNFSLFCGSSIFGSNVLNVTAWHAVGAVCDGASSLLYENSHTSSGNAGTNGNGGFSFSVFFANSTAKAAIAEMGGLNVAVSTTNLTSLISNARSRLGGF